MVKIEAKGPIVSNDSVWIYNWLGWQCTAPGMIAGKLEEAAGDEVILEINSTGGSVMAGYEIYKNIMDYPGRVTAHVIVACSAATFLACAADETKISDAGIFMIHNVQSYAEGDYRDMQMEADALRQFNEGIINIYKRKTGMNRDEIQQLMDKDSYMGPALAIEQGFVDGYIYEQRESKVERAVKNSTDFVHSVVASAVPVISPDKMQALATALKSISTSDGAAPVQPCHETAQYTGQQDNGNAGSDKEKGEKSNMTLKEFLAGNAEGQDEVNALVNEALVNGGTRERERLKSLDAIAATVPAEMLAAAKYGENPIDGPTLAYQAMLKGEKAAAAYMENAVNDVNNSGSLEVGIGTLDAGQETGDESDEIAAYVNRERAAH